MYTLKLNAPFGVTRAVLLGLGLLVLIGGMSGCSGTDAQNVTTPVQVGSWNDTTTHVFLGVSMTETYIYNLKYDRIGNIPQPFIVDVNGNYKVTGTVVHAEGPPPPIGFPSSGPDPIAAVYTGTVHGTTMTMTITVNELPGKPEILGPFTLIYTKAS